MVQGFGLDPVASRIATGYTRTTKYIRTDGGVSGDSCLQLRNSACIFVRVLPAGDLPKDVFQAMSIIRYLVSVCRDQVCVSGVTEEPSKFDVCPVSGSHHEHWSAPR